MSEYKDFAVKAVEALGTRDNFIHVSKCTRSIRVNYKHKAEVNEQLLKEVPRCAGFVNKGHQVQMIIGPGVNEAFEAFLQEAQWDINNEPVYNEPLEKDDCFAACGVLAERLRREEAFLESVPKPGLFGGGAGGYERVAAGS